MNQSTLSITIDRARYLHNTEGFMSKQGTIRRINIFEDIETFNLTIRSLI
jgi:hypothetical protein